MVAAGERRGVLRWLVVGGTCGRTAAWGDGGWWRAHAGGSVCGPCGVRVCCASAVLGGRCVDVVGVPCWYVTGRCSWLVEQEFEEVGLVCLGAGLPHAAGICGCGM